MFIFIIVLSALVQSLVALFVLQKNNKNLTNILFFFLSVFLVIWAVINFVITNDTFSSVQLILYRLLMASVVAQNTFFFLFAHVYPDQKINLRARYVKRYLLLSTIVLLATLLPLVFRGVEYGTSGARPLAGSGMPLFILHAAISVISGLRSIYKRFRQARGITKQQFRFIFFGSVLLWGIVPFTNFAISLATKTLFFARISPIYTLAFSSIIAYAIVTQKLFDIRAAVARSVTYLLSVGFIGLVYGLFIFGLSSITAFGDQNEYLQRGAYIGLALLTAALFQPIGKYFARLTNKIFYQDTYDTQIFLDELNGVLVSTIELEVLLRQSLNVIDKNISPEFSSFNIKKTPTTFASYVGNKGGMSENDLEHIKTFIDDFRHKVIITDDLPTTSDQLKAMLVHNNIAVLVRLTPNVRSTQEVGYLILGYKKSGNSYNSQDIKNLEIIAKELVIAIQNALRFEEIQSFNATLQEKINNATRELRRTNDKLKALDEAKDEFISMASHQLRTPLTSVKGYVSMVLDGDAGKISASQKKLLDQAFVSSQRMVYLIADLLNVSRLKTGKFVIEAAPTNLAEVIDGEITQLTETVKTKGLELIYDKPADFPSLMLDETKIRQVIMNFIDNAMYYTPTGGQITVSIVDKSDSVEFTVADNGIGVPASEQHHLFTKFYRAGNARKARPDGTGLGLFMAQKVIIAQGGAIIFHSIEGKGSTFGFSFPKSNKLKV